MQLDPLRPEHIFPVFIRFLSSCDTVDHSLADTEHITALIFIFIFIIFRHNRILSIHFLSALPASYAIFSALSLDDTHRCALLHPAGTPSASACGSVCLVYMIANMILPICFSAVNVRICITSPHIVSGLQYKPCCLILELMEQE